MSQYTLNPPIKNAFYNGAQGNSRLYVRPGVYLPDGDIDFQTGMLKEVSRRTGRTQALRRESHQLEKEYADLQARYSARVNEKGKRMALKTAVIAIAAAFLFFSVILLVQQGNYSAKAERLRQINMKNKSIQAVVSDISAQIDDASDPVQICYTAARELDMVPAESAQAIYLTALSTRPNQDPIIIRAGND